MPIVLQCKCGKRLKAPDHLAGRRVKCPGCGQPVTVPAAKKSSPAAPSPAPSVATPARRPPREVPEEPPRLSLCPSCEAPLLPDAAVCTQCGYNLKTGKQLKSQVARAQVVKTSSTGRPAGALWAAVISRLPPLGLVVKVGIVAVIVGGVGWWIYQFRNPPAVLGYELQTVDAYAVADGLEPTTVFRAVTPLSETFGDFSLGGRHMLVITHAAADGQFLRVHLKLSRRYLVNHDKFQRGKFYLAAGDIEMLDREGQAVTGLFLTGQQRPPAAQINMRRLPENATLPFGGPELERWRHEGEITGEVTPEYRLDGVLHAISGTWEFAGPRGLNVRLAGEGPLLAVRWGSASTAWRAAADFDDAAPAFETFGEWPVTLLFPHPGPGPYRVRIARETFPLGP